MLKNDPQLAAMDGIRKSGFLDCDKFFYGGKWHTPHSSEFYSVFNPATNEKLADVPLARSLDIDDAVAASQQGFLEWRKLSASERGQYLKKIAQILRDNAHTLAYLDALDGGSPYSYMLKDIEAAACRLEFFGGLAAEVKGSSRMIDNHTMNYTLREPIGVFAQLAAFNHPSLFVSWLAAAPLAAGNTVILKPAVQTPISTLFIAELLKNVLPAGVFNVLLGDSETGKLLCDHPGINKISLIGGVHTGRSVMHSAAEHIKRVTLEMGGKNAMVIYPDVDPFSAAQGAVKGMNFGWSGQSCSSTSRVFIHDDIYDEVVAFILKLVADIKPSIPTDQNCAMGCLVSREHYEKVMGFIHEGIKEGAKLIAGGKKPDDLELQKGNFILPTIFTDVTADMKVATEEIFGPVMCILRWKDEEKLFQQINASRSGLTGAIWTNDINIALKSARKIEAGYIWINNASDHFLGSPFGGIKQSGIGKMACFEELLQCTQEKSIHVTLR